MPNYAAQQQPPIYINCSRIESPGLRCAVCMCVFVCARDGRSLGAAHMFPPFYSKPTRGNNNKLPAHTYTEGEKSLRAMAMYKRIAQ
jgi:hypothetical protein